MAKTIEELKQMIDSVIVENGKGQITGQGLNLVLNEMSDALSEMGGGGGGSSVSPTVFLINEGTSAAPSYKIDKITGGDPVDLYNKLENDEIFNFNVIEKEEIAGMKVYQPYISMLYMKDNKTMTTFNGYVFMVLNYGTKLEDGEQNLKGALVLNSTKLIFMNNNELS